MKVFTYCFLIVTLMLTSCERGEFQRQEFLTSHVIGEIFRETGYYDYESSLRMIEGEELKNSSGGLVGLKVITESVLKTDTVNGVPYASGMSFEFTESAAASASPGFAHHGERFHVFFVFDRLVPISELSTMTESQLLDLIQSGTQGIRSIYGWGNVIESHGNNEPGDYFFVDGINKAYDGLKVKGRFSRSIRHDTVAFLVGTRVSTFTAEYLLRLPEF